MNQVLLGSEGVECNIDEVLVHGKDQQKHNERLEAVLKSLLEAGVKLNLDKCVFSTKPVKFLGHVISFSQKGASGHGETPSRKLSSKSRCISRELQY